jgi:hypothetical protein
MTSTMDVTMDVTIDDEATGAKKVLVTALKARARIDSLVSAIAPKLSAREKGDVSSSLLEEVGNTAVISRKLKEVGWYVHPNNTRPSPSVKWSEIVEKIESKQVNFVAVGANGVQVNIPEQFSSSAADSSRFAVARSIQLADKVISNDTAYELSGIIMKHGASIMSIAPDWCFNAVSNVLAKVYTKTALQGLKIEVPAWNRKVIRVRVGVQNWGTHFGLGYQLQLRARVKLLKQDTDAPGVLVGHYLCTCTCSNTLAASLEATGFVDSSSEISLIQNCTTANDGLNVTRCVWEDAETDEDEEMWMDVENEEDDGSQVDQIESVVVNRVVEPKASPAAVELMCWGDNEHGELSDKHSIIPSVALMNWQPVTPWEYIRHISTSASHTVVATSSGIFNPLVVLYV